MAWDRNAFKKGIDQRIKQVQGKKLGWAQTRPVWDWDTYQPYFPQRKAQPAFREATDFLGDWRKNVYPNQFNVSGDLIQQLPGPDGDQLPQGSIGWNWNGEPYYGDGAPGWWKGVVSRMTAPVKEVDYSYMDTLFGEGAPFLERMKSPVFWRALPGAAGEAIGFVREAGGEPGEAPTVFNWLGRGATEVIGGLLTGLGEVAKKTEQAVAVTTEGMAEAGEGGPIEELRPVGEGLPWLRKMGWFGAFLEEAMMHSPGVAIYNTARAVTGPKPFSEKMADLERSYQAGRILYSSFVNPTVDQEYRRRYDAGENPYLLAMELENPWAEMTGQLILDPLNLIGVGFLKNVRRGRQVAGVMEEFVKVAPEMADFLRTADTLSDVQAAEKIAEMARVQMTASKAVRIGLDNIARKHTLFSYTPGGNRFIVGRRTGELFGWIAANADNQDEVMEVVRGLTLMASDNADEVAQGIALTRHFKAPQPLFSRAGNELGVVMRNMLSDASGKLNSKEFLEAIAKTQGDVGKMIQLVATKADNAIAGMFPTVLERVKAGEKIGWGLQAISRFDKVAQSAVYKPINSFFAGVYMGLSPGYAFRNLVTNTAHILVDEGLAALRHKPAVWLEKTRGWLGGITPHGVAGFGKGTTGVEVVESIRKLPMSRLAEKAEIGGAAQVVGRAVEREMMRMLQPGRALPSLRPLIDAGLSNRSARYLWRLVVENKGDVKAAAQAFRTTIKTGYAEVWRSLDFLGDAERKALSDYDILDDVLKALQSDNADEAVAGLRKTFNELLAEAKRTSDEAGVIAEEAEAAQDVAALGQAFNVGDAPQELVELASNHWQANTNANYWNTQVVRQSVEGAISQARQANNADLLQKAEQAREAFRGVLDGSLEAQMKDRSLSFNARWIDGWYNRIVAQHGRGEGVSLAKAWKELGASGEVPRDWDAFKWSFWHEFFYPAKNAVWNSYREDLAKASDAVGRLFPTDNTADLLKHAKQATDLARRYDEFVPDELLRFKIADAVQRGDTPGALRIYAHQYGIPSVTEKGVTLDKMLLNIVNKNLPEGTAAFAKIDDVPIKVGQQALLRHAVKDLGLEFPVRDIAKPPTPYAGNTPTFARAISEQQEGLQKFFASLESKVRENWGLVEPVSGSPKLDQAISAWVKGAQKGVAESRLVAANVANAARDFTLLSYPEKKYIDLALAYIYPYHFWYNRTYLNWIKRVASDPQVIAGYAKYREALSKAHAGAPEWWKYNINSNELLGLDSENPLFFNLEATLNPLNGLTGVDFNDPLKRTSWFTSLLDDLGKFGPSTWTPFSIAAAFALYMQGEEEAASRWGGRLLPQTASLKSLTALLNLGPAGGVELDPMTHFFSKGMDPYERRRVGRSLGTMVEQGAISQAEALDAARQQEGPIWDQARDLSARLRAPGQLASFFLGVGFKGRNVSDIQIDRFYNDYFGLWEMEPNLSPEEFRNSMEALRIQYPFMDTVLLSRKGGLERDTGYAWNVLARIPPGQRDDIAKAVGLDYRLVEKFYASKGRVGDWAETDRERFMAAIVDVGSILEVPDDATRQEWNAAKDAYKQMDEEAKSLFGEDIWERVDRYFAAKGETPQQQDAAQAILDADPSISEALDWKTAKVMAHPLLAAYYNSTSSIEAYYRGRMYSEIEQEVGEDIWNKWDEYWTLKDTGGEYREYWKKHPELGDYIRLKGQYEGMVAKHIARAISFIPERKEGELRPGEPGSLGEEDLLAALTQEEQAGAYEFTWQEWQTVLSPPMQNIVLDYVYGGEELPESAQYELEKLSEQINLSPEAMLALIEQSLQ